MATTDVVIVGGGLSGLTAADVLSAAGLAVTVVEGRSFVGGRMMTVTPGDGSGAWFDVGATWHWEDQPRVRTLAADLAVEVFPQYRTGLAAVENSPEPAEVAGRAEVPAPVPAELRFAGGTQQVCERLASRLAASSAVLLDTTVVAIEQDGGGVSVSIVGPDDRGNDLSAHYAVVAVPPRLLIDTIAVTPDLPDELRTVIQRTPTWMATALKCIAVYEEPFWRVDGLSGLAFSQAGPLREVHDACSADAGVAALWGFVSPNHSFRDLTFDDRREQVFAQLGRLFGSVASDPLRYFERDWSGDPLTNDEVFWMGGDLLDYGHPAFTEPLLGGRLFWAGAETSADGGGHMEGAIAAGHRAAAQVLAAAGVSPGAS